MQKLLQKFQVEKHNIISIVSTLLLGSTTSFIMVLAFANLVSAQTLGTYQYIISIVSIIGAFSMTGLLTSIIRALGKQDYSFLVVAKKYLYIGSLPALIISLCVGSYYVYAGNFELGISIFIGTIIYSITFILYRFNAIYLGIDNLKTANLLLKVHAVAPLLFVLPALFLTSDGYILSILYFSGALLAFIVSIHLFGMKKTEDELIKAHKPLLESTKEHWGHVKFAFHQSVITAFNTGATHIDKIIIFQLLGAQQTAIYFVAVSLPTRLRSVVKQFEPYIFARFAKHSMTAVHNQLVKRFLATLIIIVPLYIVYVLIAPFVFNLLLPQYTNAILFSQIYAVTLFSGAFIIPQSVLKAHGETKHFYISSIFYAVTKPLLILTGIITLGLQGAIIGSAIGMLAYTLITFILAYNLSNKKSESV